MTRECVDREQLKNMIRGLTKWYVKRDNAEVGQPNTAVGLLYNDVMFGIDRLPSATPQEPNNLGVEKIEVRKPCINYEDGCEEWAGCPCVHFKCRK